MGYIEALILGIVQGLTEFLPVSSSGHLVLAEALLKVPPEGGILFEVAVHLATAAAVVLAYRRRIRAMLAAIPAMFQPWKWGRIEDPRQREHFALNWLVLLGTVPAAAVGLTFKDQIEAAFDSTRLVGAMLLLTGLILFSTRLVRPDRPRRALDWKLALLIGLAQSLALLPGVSRSGTTISAALLLGMWPGLAAEFSFLLALPAILGAGLLEFGGLLSGEAALHHGAGPLALGSLSAFVFGLAAIYFLLKALQHGNFSRFAYYVWAVGLLCLLFL